MPFQFVLANLLADHPDAIGVVFIDDSGETVDFACVDDSPFEMQLIGAYWGSYLRQVRAILEKANLGEVCWLHIERRHRHFHVAVLPDGYCLALVQREGGQVAATREKLRQAARQIAREVFRAELA